MVAISIRTNAEAVRRKVKGIRDQTPFALSQTLNDMAFEGKQDQDKQLRRRLHAPTRFTLRSIGVTKSTKRKLVATVKVKSNQRQDKLLGHLFEGGRRIGKRIEGKLIAAGIMPRGHFIVPTEATPTNAAGNIRRSFFKKVLGGLRGVRLTNRGESSLSPGVWKRSKADTKQERKRRRAGIGSGRDSELFVVHKQLKNASAKKTARRKSERAPTALLLFVPRARYRKRFNLPETVSRRVKLDFNKTFTRRFRAAERTALRFR